MKSERYDFKKRSESWSEKTKWTKKRSELKNEVWKKKFFFEVNKRSELCEVKKWSQVKNEVH